ncbi:uncharacterized protein METZ01_LOCUS306856 [marine metagenome]|uniref:Uncharacterized protein n=1 Tax=marine metagenome TaxID=408172 RepID=A0A382N2F9_9ZZZZ
MTPIDGFLGVICLPLDRICLPLITSRFGPQRPSTALSMPARVDAGGNKEKPRQPKLTG